jgi:hypothetical protein
MPQLGQTLTIDLAFPASAGMGYIAGASAGVYPGQPLPDGRALPVNVDPLFTFSLSSAQSVFTGMAGSLNALGAGSFQIHVPNDPALSGFSAWFSAVTLASANTIGEIAPWVKLTLP